MREIELVNCTNYFNEVGCKRLSDVLENNKAVRIHIDCIGHAATERETANYIEWMQETYGDRLEKDIKHGETIYFLKN